MLQLNMGAGEGGEQRCDWGRGVGGVGGGGSRDVVLITAVNWGSKT